MSGRFSPDLDLTGLFAPHPGPQVTRSGAAPDGTHVLRVGDGPDLCSSSQELDHRIVHDVNGFYALLGVGHKATRGELSRAYLAAGGPGDSYLTMVLMILLDPVQRRIYNGLPLGVRFNDPETQATAKREDAVWILKNPCTDSSESVHRLADGAAYSEVHPYRRAPDRRPQSGWDYAYHVWDAVRATARALPAWQHLIIQALGQSGAQPMRFAVGHRAPGTEPVAALIGHTPVAFLPWGREPTEDLARTAAAMLRTLNGATTTTSAIGGTATRPTDTHQGAPQT